MGSRLGGRFGATSIVLTCLPMDRRARREVLGIVSLLIMFGTDLRAPVDGCITASDACETGLGVSRSVGLTARGASVGTTMDERGDCGVLNVIEGLFYCEGTVVLFSVLDGI